MDNSAPAESDPVGYSRVGNNSAVDRRSRRPVLSRRRRQMSCLAVLGVEMRAVELDAQRLQPRSRALCVCVCVCVCAGSLVCGRCCRTPTPCSCCSCSSLRSPSSWTRAATTRVSARSPARSAHRCSLTPPATCSTAAFTRATPSSGTRSATPGPRPGQPIDSSALHALSPGSLPE